MHRFLALAALLVADVTPRGDFFRAETAKLVGTLQIGTIVPTTLGFSRDSRRLIVLSSDGRLALWDLGARREVRGAAVSFFEGRFVLSADGTRALGPSPDRRSVRLIDVERGSEIRNFPDCLPTQNQTYALSPDGRRVVVVRRDQSVRIFDAASGDEVRSLIGPATGQGGSMAWSPDGKIIAVHGWDSTVRYFDPATGETTATSVSMGQLPIFMGFSPDSSKLVVVNQEARIQLTDRKGQEVRAFDEVLTGPRSIAFSPDGQLMVASDIQGKTRIWNTKTWRHLRDLDAGPARHAAFSPDGRYLAIAGADGRVKIWGAAGSFGPSPAAPGYLGIFGDPVESDEKGVLIVSTSAGGPAEKAGLQAGDKIVKIGTHATDTFEGLRAVVVAMKEGDEVEVVFVREGVEKKVKIKLAARPPNAE